MAEYGTGPHVRESILLALSPMSIRCLSGTEGTLTVVMQWVLPVALGTAETRFTTHLPMCSGASGRPAGSAILPMEGGVAITISPTRIRLGGMRIATSLSPGRRVGSMLLPATVTSTKNLRPKKNASPIATGIPE